MRISSDSEKNQKGKKGARPNFPRIISNTALQSFKKKKVFFFL